MKNGIWTFPAATCRMPWAEDGIIIPLEDLINEHMPNFKKVLDENPEYLAMVTAPDGHIYSLPWIEELGQDKESIHTVNDIPWINVDWLEALGLEMPQTTDELMVVLEPAFPNCVTIITRKTAVTIDI